MSEKTKDYRSKVTVPFKSHKKLHGQFTIEEALNVLKFDYNGSTQLSHVENLFRHATGLQARLAFMNCQSGELCALLSFPTHKECKKFEKTLPTIVPNVAFG